MNWFFLFLAFLIGIANAIQSGVNAQLRESLQNPILAGLVSFAVGLVVLAVAFAFFNTYKTPSPEVLRQLSWWRLMGGVLGAFYIITVIFIIRDIGPANMICLIVAGQMISALVIDHFGLQGFEVHKINLPRIFGTLLLVAGVYLIVKN